MEPLNSYHVHHHHHYAADSIKQKDIDKEEDTAEKKMTKPTLSTYIGHDPLDPKSKAHPKKYETNIDAHVAERKEHAAVKRIPDPIERLHLSGPTDLSLKEKLDEAVVAKETKQQESAPKKESLQVLEAPILPSHNVRVPEETLKRAEEAHQQIQQIHKATLHGFEPTEADREALSHHGRMQREIAKRREADGYHVDLQKHQLVPLDAAKSTSETDKREPKHASAEAKAYPSDTHHSQPEHLKPAVPGDHLRAVAHSPPEVHHEQQKQPDTGKRPTLHATPTTLGVTGKIGKLGDELTPYEYSQSHPKEEPKPAPREVKEPAHEMSLSQAQPPQHHVLTPISPVEQTPQEYYQEYKHFAPHGTDFQYEGVHEDVDLTYRHPEQDYTTYRSSKYVHYTQPEHYGDTLHYEEPHHEVVEHHVETQTHHITDTTPDYSAYYKQFHIPDIKETTKHIESYHPHVQAGEVIHQEEHQLPIYDRPVLAAPVHHEVHHETTVYQQPTYYQQTYQSDVYHEPAAAAVQEEVVHHETTHYEEEPHVHYDQMDFLYYPETTQITASVEPVVHETHHEAVVQPTAHETEVVHEIIPHSFEIPHTESHTTTYEATAYDTAGAYAAYQPYGYGYAQTSAYNYPYYQPQVAYYGGYGQQYYGGASVAPVMDMDFQTGVFPEDHTQAEDVTEVSQDPDVVSYQDYPYSYDMDASYAVQEAVDQHYDYDTEASYDQMAEQTYYDGDYVPEIAPVASESLDLAEEGPWNYHYDSDYSRAAVKEHVVDHSYDEVADVSHVDEAQIYEDLPYEAYDYAGYPEPWTQHYGTPVAELTHEVEEYHEEPIVQPYEVHSEISMGDYKYPEDLHDTYTTVDHAEDKFWEVPAAETHHYDDWSYQYADPYQQPVDESAYEQHYDHHYAQETSVVDQDDWSYPEDTYAEAAISYAEPEEAYSYADAEAYSYADPEDAFSFADYQLPQAETIEETHVDDDHFDGDYYGADDVYDGYSRADEDVYDAAEYAGYDYADYADYAGYADGGYADEYAAGYTDAEPAIPLSDIKYDQPMGGAYDELTQQEDDLSWSEEPAEFEAYLQHYGPSYDDFDTFNEIKEDQIEEEEENAYYIDDYHFEAPKHTEREVEYEVDYLGHVHVYGEEPMYADSYFLQ